MILHYTTHYVFCCLGNLALSRAFGDFVFKKNEKKPAHEQIVTAFPDVTVEPVSRNIISHCIVLTAKRKSNISSIYTKGDQYGHGYPLLFFADKNSSLDKCFTKFPQGSV